MMMTLVKTKKSPYYQAKIRLVRGGPILYRSTGERHRVRAVTRLHELVEAFRVKPGRGMPGGQPTIAAFYRLPPRRDGGEYWTYRLPIVPPPHAPGRAIFCAPKSSPPLAPSPLTRSRLVSLSDGSSALVSQAKVSLSLTPVFLTITIPTE